MSWVTTKTTSPVKKANRKATMNNISSRSKTNAAANHNANSKIPCLKVKSAPPRKVKMVARTSLAPSISGKCRISGYRIILKKKLIEDSMLGLRKSNQLLRARVKAPKPHTRKNMGVRRRRSLSLRRGIGWRTQQVILSIESVSQATGTRTEKRFSAKPAARVPTLPSMSRKGRRTSAK